MTEEVEIAPEEPLNSENDEDGKLVAEDSPLTELQSRIVEELGNEPMTAPQLCEKLTLLGFEFEPDTIRINCVALKRRGILRNQRGMGYIVKAKPPKPEMD